MIDNKQQPLFLIGSACVAASCGIAVTSLFLLFKAVFHQPDEYTFNQRQAATALSIDTGAITNRNFFGDASNTELELLPEDLPETKLELILRGAFTSTEDNSTGAIIEDDRKISRHYRIGDTLPGDAQLKKVYKDRVILSRNGLLETLYFPEASSISSIGSSTSYFDNSNQEPTAETKARQQAIRDRIKKLRNKR